ncbi:MAG TPA: GGDEF domain-containing protein [Thermoanaerobaculia bacterium]|nr:GGDEF domain-containing protein [Thermoanaerobaculia bacterium]
MNPLLRTLLALAFAAAAAADDARDFERGFPPVDVHPMKRHDGGSQIFSAAQGTDGILYFGGLRGLTSYDGAWWQNAELPNDSAVFAVAIGRGPEIAVGAVGEVGWFVRDPNGKLVYRSLLGLLPAAQRDVGDVRSVCATQNGFLYAAEYAVIAWNGGAPRVLADLRSRTEMPRCFETPHGTYVALSDGLHRVDGSTLVRAGFDGKQVELVLPFDDRRILAVVAGEGVFLSDETETTPFAPDATEWLRGKSVRAGRRLQDGRFVIGTRQHGVLILDQSGSVQLRLTAAAGLPDDVLSSVLQDREGALWLTYYGPIARVDLATPVTRIDSRRGLAGTPNDVTRHRNALYVATSHGLFKTDRRSAAGDPGHAFRPVDGIPAPGWRTLSLGNELLVGTSNGIYSVDENDVPRLVPATAQLVVYFALPSQQDPSRVWLATKTGIGSIRREGREWRFESLIAGSPRHGRQIREMDGILWISTTFDGIVRIDPRAAPARIDRFGREEAKAVVIGGRVGAIGSGRILRIAGDRLEPDPRFASIGGPFFLGEEDSRGNLWINNTPPAMIRKLPDGGYAREALPIPLVDASHSGMMNLEEDVLWFGGSEGLFRYDFRDVRTAAPQPRPRIHRVVTGDGTEVTAPLRHAFGRLHFEFAPASFRPGTLYQYRLEPEDAGWSAWSSEPAVDYTNLGHGNYTLRVRARGVSGAVSEETSWSFRVLPPWYRTRPAIAFWIFLGALLVAAIVRLRTAALRRQAERLRLLVDERTEELRQANAHLERLSLLDELTGIANRRYFQRALAEDWRNALEHRQPLALILLDLDKFKLINDRHGHPAGDAALVQVGRTLNRQIRRSGELTARANDIVARIGGEEFAVLLTRTGEEEALRVAEQLRNIIADVPLELGEETLRITASCGVAAVIPTENDGWHVLLGEADRALYAAKADGRNCVRTAPPASDVAQVS